ncbi:hypothetical protein C5B96_13325 [Subtercola sp. Z020]|nr:hypothetical protein C5B96_13325 [Subtercola sp. Z020]
MVVVTGLGRVRRRPRLRSASQGQAVDHGLHSGLAPVRPDPEQREGIGRAVSAGNGRCLRRRHRSDRVGDVLQRRDVRLVPAVVRLGEVATSHGDRGSPGGCARSVGGRGRGGRGGRFCERSRGGGHRRDPCCVRAGRGGEHGSRSGRHREADHLQNGPAFDGRIDGGCDRSRGA